MTEQNATQLAPNSSIEKITAVLTQIRDKQVLELLTEAGLVNFMESHFNTVAISAVKTEFLKRDLKQLLGEQLDLAYYSSLINQLKNSGNQTTVEGHRLFLQEVLTIFSKYGVNKPD